MPLDPIGTYSFLPWLRRGIATTITAAPAGASRATVPVDLRVTGDKIGGGTVTQDVHRDVQLYGPGDIVGLDARAIVRMEPRHWVTNFEPNYLPFVEFYDEDLPWRYTPAPPTTGTTKRLTPWLALVVLADGEFVDDGGSAPDTPLPFVTVDDLGRFPPAAGLWAWAHVHVNRSLAAGTEIFSDDAAGSLGRFDGVMADNPDHGSSRLICPRRLTTNTAYHAFLVPSFESGRLAGLGLDPEDAPGALTAAWEAYPARADHQGARFPYYHRWYFRTGNVGDFEYLVRLLQPRKVDPRVGQRDMDVQDPGADLPGITDPALGGVLRLGGALQIPEVNLTTADKAQRQLYEDWDQPYPHPFQRQLADLVNLADDYLAGDATDPDPLITPPLYGRWHALTDELLSATPTPPATTTNWVHELNLDPRFRVPAGFGTGVVQKNQEDYMAAAWQQIGAVLEANRRMRLAQLAREIGRRWHRRHFGAQLAADPARVLALTAPLQRRVLADGVTVAHRVATSVSGPALLSTAMRRITRPGSRLVRRGGFDGPADAARLVARVARGEVTPARPKARPRVPTLAVVAKRLAPRVGNNRHLIELLDETKRDPEAIRGFPRVPDFRITKPSREPVRFEQGDRDNRAATGLKGAIRDAANVITASTEAGAVAPRGELDVHGLAARVLHEIRPDVTIPRRVLDGLHIPDRLRPRMVEEFKEALAYPEIDVPMYQPLVDLSSELFLPNLNLIEQNSITLLETNQRFIESYMVGLNHELARELLWREYPTDQRGSYFRQFWDPKGQMSKPAETPEARRERLRDIPPLHLWSRGSNLGSHDHRELVPGASEEEVVLVVRGELLKRYPTAVIYAQKADWPRVNGVPVKTGERVPIDLSAAEQAEPPPGKLRLPLYEAKVDPDIYFFGFDLTAEDAKGDMSVEDLGWFFIIRERPGEPRFGLDIERSGGLNTWNDLAWPDAAPNQEAFVPAGPGAPTRNVTKPTAQEDQEKLVQWEDDKALHWGADINSSEVAYILYQAPVLVAVHGEEMLGHG